METVIRVAIIYLFIVLGLRVLGKREFGQLSPLELVTLLIIPEIVSESLVREDPSMINGLVAVCTLLVLVYLFSLLQHQSEAVEKVFSSSPTVLVQSGYYVDTHMNQERVSPGEIFDAIHEAGLERMEQVKWAILQSDGKITIVPQEADRNVVSGRTRREPIE